MHLKVQGLSKCYGHRELFHIEHLLMQEGESCYLRGENGAGKTTLMKILSGLEKPSRGRVEISPKSQNWWGNGLHPRVIYLHQTPYLFQGDVASNLSYGLRVRHQDRQQIQDKVAQVMDWAGLEHLASQQAHSLSGGEKQRLALARACILEPLLIFLDEPTANLDKPSILAVAGLVSDLLEQGTTVMVSSHQENNLTELCQRKLHLAAGSLTEYSVNGDVTYHA